MGRTEPFRPTVQFFIFYNELKNDVQKILLTSPLYFLVHCLVSVQVKQFSIRFIFSDVSGFFVFFSSFHFIPFPKTHFYSFHEPITIIIVMMMVSDVSAQIRCARNTVGLCGPRLQIAGTRGALCGIMPLVSDGWGEVPEAGRCTKLYFLLIHRLP